MPTTDTPVDAVITWVDGSDPAHQQKLANQLIALGRTPPKSVTGSRLSDAGELELNVRFLLKNAPWIRTIFIVTDNQTPSFLVNSTSNEYAKKVKVIDHREIFSGYEEGLPSFNTKSIAMLLWKIKGLAEHFLYLNDDFFIVRPVTKKDFFDGDNILARGHWKYFYGIKPALILRLSRFFKAFEKKYNKPGYLKSQFLTAQEFGFKWRFFSLSHNPHAMKKSIFNTYFQQKPEHARNMVSHPFRSARQIVAESLSLHASFKKGQLIIDKQGKDTIVHAFDSSPRKITQQLKEAENDPHRTFICIQDLAGASKDVQNLILNWLCKQLD